MLQLVAQKSFGVKQHTCTARTDGGEREDVVGDLLEAKFGDHGLALLGHDELRERLDGGAGAAEGGQVLADVQVGERGDGPRGVASLGVAVQS